MTRKTESVKLDRAIVRRLRRYSRRSGIPISRIAKRLLEQAMNDPNWIDIFVKPGRPSPLKEN